MAVEGQAAETGQQQQSGSEGQKPEGQQQQQITQTQNVSAQGVSDPAKTQSDSRRDQGILRDLQSERKQRQTFERQFQEAQAQNELLNKRIQALAGVNPKSEGEAEVEEIRGQFSKLFPDLAGLTAEDIKGIREAVQAQKALQETTNHYWRTHGQGMINAVAERIQDEIGGELTQRQKDALTVTYIRMIEAGDPELLRRHEDGDPKLLEEFSKNWIEDWFEPARRVVTRNAVGRLQTRVPSGRGTGSVTTQKPKIDYKNPKSVEDAMVAAFTEAGGAFGRERN